MLRPDKICQADRCQFLTDTGNIYAEGIIIHIKLIIPEKIHNIVPGTDFSGILEKVIKDFQFVFR